MKNIGGHIDTAIDAVGDFGSDAIDVANDVGDAFADAGSAIGDFFGGLGRKKRSPSFYDFYDYKNDITYDPNPKMNPWFALFLTEEA